MNLFSEFHKLWFLSPDAIKLCPIEKVFTGSVPDKYTTKEGETKDLDPPYVCMWSPDGSPSGGTSFTIQQMYVVQFSCFHVSRAGAETIRNFVRQLYEDPPIEMAAALAEYFQDCSIDSCGELPARNGVYEVFQRFNVETAIQRPRRKRV